MPEDIRTCLHVSLEMLLGLGVVQLESAYTGPNHEEVLAICEILDFFLIRVLWVNDAG